MPASFSPAPNSMASLSIEEGGVASCMGVMGTRPSPVNLDTATPTVPVIPPMGQATDKASESDMSSGARSVGGSEGEKDGEKDGKKKKSRCLSCKKKVGLTGICFSTL